MRNFELVLNQSKFNPDASRRVFARSAESAETLRNVLRHTDQKRRFVVHEHDRSAVLFYTLWLKAGGDFSLHHF